MNDTDNTQTTASKTPSHFAFHVRDRDGDKGFFTPIGAAWAHKDGQGFTIKLETFPIDGRITLRVFSNNRQCQ